MANCSMLEVFGSFYQLKNGTGKLGTVAVLENISDKVHVLKKQEDQLLFYKTFKNYLVS